MDGLASQSIPRVSFLQRFFFGVDTKFQQSPLDVQHEIAGWMPSSLFYPLILKPDKILEGHADPIRHVSFSNDGNYIVTESKTELCLWDRIQGRLIQKLKSENIKGGPLLEMGAFDPTTKILAIASTKGLKLFDIETRTEKTEQTPVNWPFGQIWFSRDGKIIGSSRGRYTFTYDSATKKVETIDLGGDHFLAFNAFSMTHDGLHLVGDEINYDYLVIYNLISKKLMRLNGRFGGGVRVNNDITKGVATDVLSLDWGCAVLLQLNSEVSLKHTLPKQHRCITCEGISPQGTIIFSGSEYAKGRMWATETGTCLAILPCGIAGGVKAGSFNALGNCVALGCDNRLYLFSCFEVEKTFINFLRKKVNLQQLLAIKFFDLMRQLGSDKIKLFKQLNLTESDMEELRQAFYSFNDEAVRRHLKAKYKLPWPSEAS